jgi:hypothetical protein
MQQPFLGYSVASQINKPSNKTHYFLTISYMQEDGGLVRLEQHIQP